MPCLVTLRNPGFIYSDILWAPHFQYSQVWITQFYLQITPYLPLSRNCSPDGATTDCYGWHVIASYYSLIDPEKMKGWVCLVGRHIADGLPHKRSPVSCRSSAVRWSQIDALPLRHSQLPRGRSDSWWRRVFSRLCQRRNDVFLFLCMFVKFS